MARAGPVCQLPYDEEEDAKRSKVLYNICSTRISTEIAPPLLKWIGSLPPWGGVHGVANNLWQNIE